MIKHLCLEKKIHLILILIFYSIAWILLPGKSVKFIELLHCYVEITVLAVIFYSQIFWLLPKLMQIKNTLSYLIITGIGLLFLFLITMLINLHAINFSIIHSNIWILQEEIGAYLLSIFYFLIRNVLKKIIVNGIIRTRTLVILVITSIFLITTYFVGRQYYYQNYKGDSKIVFIPESDSIKSISELVHLELFQGSVLYIDYWGTHCSPCLKEFGYKNEMKLLKKRYEKRPVKFLYIADMMSNEYSRWKRIIDDFELDGYHMQMNKQLLEDFSKIKGWGGYMPLFILIDKNGNVINPNAERPSSKEKLYTQIDKLL
jgi:thiol-disulfide isomerase/thioredoxin